jgi:hypothetical protein
VLEVFQHSGWAKSPLASSRSPDLRAEDADRHEAVIRRISGGSGAWVVLRWLNDWDKQQLMQLDGTYGHARRRSAIVELRLKNGMLTSRLIAVCDPGLRVRPYARSVCDLGRDNCLAW